MAGEVAEAWREEGIAEGATRTLRDVLPMVVQARFGVAPPVDLPSRLTHCTLPQLQQAQAAVMTSPTLEAWLAALSEKAQ